MAKPTPASPKLFTPVNLARLLLVVLPSVPGLHTPGKNPTPAAQAAYLHATEQAKQLFLVGAATLIVGTFGMAATIWKIARTHPVDPDVPHENGEP